MSQTLETPLTPNDEPLTVIVPTRGFASFQFREVWEYRELLRFLAERDLKVRYKQTLLGAAWAVIQPLFTMIVFTLFFGKLGRMPSDGLPYSVFSYTALVPWTFFATNLTMSANSLVNNSHLLTKVYFPRILIPLASVLPSLVDFGLAFLVLLGMVAYHGIVPTANLVWLPLFLVMAAAASVGAGLWLAALNVQFRDVRYAVPFLLQFWLFITPVAYPSSLLQEPWKTLYGLNPMAGVVEGFRWSLLGLKGNPGMLVLASALAALLLLVSGLLYFRRMERTFADTV
jgi:lipopolysaccharide transport system permease protein